MNTVKARRLMARMEAALRRGDTPEDRQAAYRYGVAALQIENAYRLLCGAQPITVSARTRAVAAGNAA